MSSRAIVVFNFDGFKSFAYLFMIYYQMKEISLENLFTFFFVLKLKHNHFHMRFIQELREIFLWGIENNKNIYTCDFS